MTKRRPLTTEQQADADRLKAIYEKRKSEAKALGKRLTQDDVASACEWSGQSAFSQYARGTIPLNLDALLRLSRALNFKPHEVSPRLAAEISGGIPQETKPTPESSNVTLTAQPARFYRYPVLSEVQAGAWTEAIQPYEPGAEDRFELTDYQARGPAFWLRVSGDSMTSPISPSIPEGHFILVDTGLVPQPGDLVVAKLDTEEKATFKKLVSDAGQLYLKPLNPAYRMIPIDGNCRLIGVVKEAKVKL